MLLSSYKTWRHGIKIRKNTLWGTQLYTAKRRKWISPHWLKRWLKATYSTISKDENPHQPDSSTAAVENGLVTKTVGLKPFQEQNRLSGLSTPSRISVCSCNTLSNPHSLTNCTLGKIFVATAVSSYSSSKHWRTKLLKTYPWYVSNKAFVEFTKAKIPPKKLIQIPKIRNLFSFLIYSVVLQQINSVFVFPSHETEFTHYTLQ